MDKQLAIEELTERLGLAETHYADSFTSSHNMVGLAAQWQLIQELRAQLIRLQREAARRIINS